MGVVLIGWEPPEAPRTVAAAASGLPAAVGWVGPAGPELPVRMLLRCCCCCGCCGPGASNLDAPMEVCLPAAPIDFAIEPRLPWRAPGPAGPVALPLGSVPLPWDPLDKTSGVPGQALIVLRASAGTAPGSGMDGMAGGVCPLYAGLRASRDPGRLARAGPGTSRAGLSITFLTAWTKGVSQASDLLLAALSSCGTERKSPHR